MEGFRYSPNIRGTYIPVILELKHENEIENVKDLLNKNNYFEFFKIGKASSLEIEVYYLDQHFENKFQFRYIVFINDFGGEHDTYFIENFMSLNSFFKDYEPILNIAKFIEQQL